MYPGQGTEISLHRSGVFWERWPLVGEQGVILPVPLASCGSECLVSSVLVLTTASLGHLSLQGILGDWTCESEGREGWELGLLGGRKGLEVWTPGSEGRGS